MCAKFRIILIQITRKHGTFRPKLLALVQSNSEDEIKTITKQAVELISQQNDATDLSALKVLVGLSGIGPATASLLLSVMQPKTRPFFSDEMYRWAVWGDEHGITGWKRKIKYSTSEYAIIVKRVEDLRNRLGKDKVSALDAERVAWVLGKEITNINAEEEGEMIDMLEKNTERVTELKDSVEDDHIKPVQSKLKRPTKRKAVDPIVPSEGIRKSTRTRK